MELATSRDGTTIAFDRIGSGPPIILVGGALSLRSGPDRLVERLSQQFTVFDYDRRGRGDSGDTAPYAVEREIEDIDAVIAAAGGSASVYGISSGAILALEAAQRLPDRVNGWRSTSRGSSSMIPSRRSRPIMSSIWTN